MSDDDEGRQLRKALWLEVAIVIVGACILAVGLTLWLHPGAGLAALGAVLIAEMKLGD